MSCRSSGWRQVVGCLRVPGTLFNDAEIPYVRIWRLEQSGSIVRQIAPERTAGPPRSGTLDNAHGHHGYHAAMPE
ncbi:hypothetical protein NCS52_00704000 [Fusarium sp. LHS14.1]|nr:hypothetical protein NCS52_00704000 [Fusarium sp. LHS14.1]